MLGQAFTPTPTGAHGKCYGMLRVQTECIALAQVVGVDGFVNVLGAVDAAWRRGRIHSNPAMC